MIRLVFWRLIHVFDFIIARSVAVRVFVIAMLFRFCASFNGHAAVYITNLILFSAIIKL